MAAAAGGGGSGKEGRNKNVIKNSLPMTLQGYKARAPEGGRLLAANDSLTRTQPHSKERQTSQSKKPNQMCP